MSVSRNSLWAKARMGKMPKCKQFFLLSAVLFMSFTILLSTPVMASEMWQQNYGGPNDDRAYSMVQTSDGGLALGGFTMSYGAGLLDFYLIKTDGSGNLSWNQTYGGAGSDVANSLVQTSDGGYALAGATESFGAGGSDFWLVKTDTNGNMMWNQTYGGTDFDGARSVVQTSDGGYALAGRTDSFGAGHYDFWLVKTDANGNMIWNKTYGGAERDLAYSLVQTTDGGFALAGYTESFGAGDYDFWLVKTDANGNMIWNKTYGGTDHDEATSLVQTSDEGYVLAGSANSFDNGGVWLVKTDVSGNMIWNKTYGQQIDKKAQSVIETSDGGYSLTGTGGYVWLIKTNGNGDILFYQTYAGTQWYEGYTQVDNAYCLVQTSNGDYALAGYTISNKEGVSPDAFLIKPDHEVPIIWNVLQNPTSSKVNSTDTVHINATVYDVSGINEVTFSYMTEGGSWKNLTMTNSAGNVYSADIEAFPEDTVVFYKISAENNIGKSATIDREYSVIPEFPSWIILPLFVIATLAIVIYRNRL
jgi:hypothetical protein